MFSASFWVIRPRKKKRTKFELNFISRALRRWSTMNPNRMPKLKGLKGNVAQLFWYCTVLYCVLYWYFCRPKISWCNGLLNRHLFNLNIVREMMKNGWVLSNGTTYNRVFNLEVLLPDDNKRVKFFSFQKKTTTKNENCKVYYVI